MFDAERFVLRKKAWEDLTSGQRMYGENEPPEKQLETQWEVVDCYTGQALCQPQPDFAEFTKSDRMYPSMMNPEVKSRWELKNSEWTSAKEQFRQIKRMCHACFMKENREHDLARKLAETDYGKALAQEYTRHFHPSASKHQAGMQQPGFHPQPPALFADAAYPKVRAALNLHDNFAHEVITSAPQERIRTTPFTVPGAEDPFSILVTARDESGRITEKSLSNNAMEHRVHYEYDAGGRLSRVYKDERPIEHYRYGKHGERLMAETFNSGIRRFVYGESLRLVRAGEVKYSYNPEGRLTAKQDRGQITRFEYDSNGQLAQVYLPDETRISYIVDPDGIRIAKQINGKTAESYSWKDRSTLAVVADAKGRRMEFAYDENGNPVAMRINDETVYFATDQAGTVYMAADSKGNELKRIICDSFGNIIVDTNEQIEIPLGFAAGLFDRDTGLVHLGHREYDPAIGRFITPAPSGCAGGDVDVYSYCSDDPVNFIDRLGLECKAGENVNRPSPKAGTEVYSNRNPGSFHPAGRAPEEFSPVAEKSAYTGNIYGNIPGSITEATAKTGTIVQPIKLNNMLEGYGDDVIRFTAENNAEQVHENGFYNNPETA